LAVGAALFPPGRADDFVKPLLERLSRQFGEAQYFCTHRDFGLQVWARARGGRLVRGYGWLGRKGLTLWDEGRPTKEERDLGLRPPAAEPAQDTNITSGVLRPDDRITRRGRGEDVTPPDEGGLLQLASLWSIDPTTLGEQFKEPVTGWLGDVAWGEGRTGGLR
jgi:hypothetical protein